MLEAKPDAESPRVGEFELTLEQMVTLLEDRLGELTLEVRGLVNDCAFVGTAAFEVIETEIEEPSEPVGDEPAEVADESGEVDEAPESDLEQTEPVEEAQEQTESTDEVEDPVETTEDAQEQTATTQGEGESQPQAVESTEPVGVVEEDEDEDPEAP